MILKTLLPLSLVALILASSGCVNNGFLAGNRPEDVVRSISEVQDFLSRYPESDLEIKLRSEGYVRSALSEISEKCGNQFTIAEHWEVTFTDSATDRGLVVWLEKETNGISCIYGEGGEVTNPAPQKPASGEITVTGFSDIEIDSKTTRFSGGTLFLTVTNPLAQRISIKRVVARYLDDVIDNTSDSGLLEQGDSFTYTFDFSRTIEGDTFWIDADITYDNIDTIETNIKSRGSIIKGFDTTRILECSSASFDITRQNFYFGTRILSVVLENTGSIDLDIVTYFRNETADLEKVKDPVELKYGDTVTIELTGLNRLMESVIYFSEACPNARQVIFVDDIPGV